MPSLMIVNPSRHHKRHARKTRKNPSHKRRRSHRRNPLVMDLGGRSGLRRYRAKKNPFHRRRRVRRNPIGLRGGSGIVGQVVPVVAGAGAALGVDYLLDKLPLPLTLKMGMPAHLVRIAAALGLGVVVGMVAKNKALGARVGAGAATVVTYDIAKELIAKRAAAAMPGVTMRVGESHYPEVGWAGRDNVVSSVYDEGTGELINPMGELLEQY